MLKRTEKLLRSPIRLIPFIIFGILLTASVNIIVTSVNYQDIKERFEISQEQNKEEIWSEIESAIKDEYRDNKVTSGFIALDIENHILREYPDLNELKSEFDNKAFSEKFHDLVKNGVGYNDVKTKFDPYLTLVGTRDKLILASTNNENSLVKHIDSDSILEWESLSDYTPNQQLTNTALESIFNKESKVIFTQTSSDFIKKDEVDIMSLDALKSIYQKYGFEGLYDISIIAPGFITENGDVFGTDDRYYLSKTNNYKLVVLQIISLETIIDEHNERISLEIENNNMEEQSIEHFMLQQLLTMVTISAMLFIISLLLIGTHNVLCDKNRRLDNESGS